MSVMQSGSHSLLEPSGPAEGLLSCFPWDEVRLYVIQYFVFIGPCIIVIAE